MKERLVVIQEHNAKRAGLHWDLRVQVEGSLNAYRSMRSDTNEPDDNERYVLRSWAIPKHRFPNATEKLLAIQTEDHPWSYKDFSGTITGGYGAGDVKLLFCDSVIVRKISLTKFTFTMPKWEDGKDVTFNLFPIEEKKWLIQRVDGRKYELADKLARKRAKEKRNV